MKVIKPLWHVLIARYSFVWSRFPLNSETLSWHLWEDTVSPHPMIVRVWSKNLPRPEIWKQKFCYQKTFRSATPLINRYLVLPWKFMKRTRKLWKFEWWKSDSLLFLGTPNWDILQSQYLNVFTYKSFSMNLRPRKYFGLLKYGITFSSDKSI